jgi:hypothetical protein
MSTQTPQTAYERGHQDGLIFKCEGRRYGKQHGTYPSNPYHISDARAAAYDSGYDDAWKEQQ